MSFLGHLSDNYKTMDMQQPFFLSYAMICARSGSVWFPVPDLPDADNRKEGREKVDVPLQGLVRFQVAACRSNSVNYGMSLDNLSAGRYFILSLNLK